MNDIQQMVRQHLTEQGLSEEGQQIFLAKVRELSQAHGVNLDQLLNQIQEHATDPSLIEQALLVQLVNECHQHALDLNLMGFKCRWVKDTESEGYWIHHNFARLAHHQLFEEFMMTKQNLLGHRADLVQFAYAPPEAWIPVHEKKTS